MFRVWPRESVDLGTYSQCKYLTGTCLIAADVVTVALDLRVLKMRCYRFIMSCSVIASNHSQFKPKTGIPRAFTRVYDLRRSGLLTAEAVLNALQLYGVIQIRKLDDSEALRYRAKGSRSVLRSTAANAALTVCARASTCVLCAVCYPCSIKLRSFMRGNGVQQE